MADQTLIKGLDVLGLIVDSERGLRITDVAQQLDLTKSNAYRSLRTLEAAGYILQDPITKDFFPSLKLWEMGSQVVDRQNFRSRAADGLRWLNQASGETVHLAVRDGLDVIYIDKIDSPEPVKSYSRLGARAPAYCVATGKALLADLSDVELDEMPKLLPPNSSKTIKSLDQLRSDLQATRDRGYSINRGEWRASVWGLAAVIPYKNGVVAAAVGVSGPDFRISVDGRCDELGSLVVQAAEMIAQNF